MNIKLSTSYAIMRGVPYALLILIVGSAFALASCGELLLPCLLGDYETVVFIPFNESGCPEIDPPGNVGGLEAIGRYRAVLLTWTNPVDSDLTEVVLFWRNNNDPSDAGTHTFASVIPGEKMTYVISGLKEATPYTFLLKTIDTFKNSEDIDMAYATAVTSPPIDINGNGLIDIYDIDTLNNIRYNLAGTSYKTSEQDVGARCNDAAYTIVDCAGYELMVDLDFTVATSYALGSVNDDWRPNQANPAVATNLGWIPIGDGRNPFVTVFEGNEHAIRNLYARGDGEIGLFGVVGAAGSAGTIRNLSVIGSTVYGGRGTDTIGSIAGRLAHGVISTAFVLNGATDGGEGAEDMVGGLVGHNNGTIERSTVTGMTSTANGGAGTADAVGGLVGYNDSSGRITNSSAVGSTHGGSGDDDYVGGLAGKNRGTIGDSFVRSSTANGGAGAADAVGGLVGYNGGGVISGSYALGTATGGTGDSDMVGGLVGKNNAVIIASYTTIITANATVAVGGTGSADAVGALVGHNDTNGEITASYANGDADGGDDSNDRVGALVGRNSGSITASYATGAANGGSGAGDRVGGLVGESSGSITASYAIGAADGGSGANDHVGGIVGKNSGEISHSYTIANATGGIGSNDYVGIFIGEDSSVSNAISASYGFGNATDNEQGVIPSAGTSKPSGMTSAADISATNAAGWIAAAGAAWKFRNADNQSPVLKYADYDGRNGIDYCALFPDTVPGATDPVDCGTTLLQGQSGTSLLNIDQNNNNLIDIRNLDMLYNIRYSLDGKIYKASFDDLGLKCGRRADQDCFGYELVRNLDFAANGSYQSHAIQNDWRPNHTNPARATNSGWIPIGDAINPFRTTIDGNGHTIRNLYVRGNGTVGLFGVIGRVRGVGSLVVSGVVRNLTVVHGRAYGSSNNSDRIGIITGQLSSGMISNSAAIGGSVDGLAGATDNAGGLVGQNNGIVVDSHATIEVSGGSGNGDRVGGLVGWNAIGTIAASYATGSVTGRGGTAGSIGGLAGLNGGVITNSHATGSAKDGGPPSNIGGLVGSNNGSIAASYATGDAIGEVSSISRSTDIGGLVGENVGTIIASYATGGAISFWSIQNDIGGLVGYNNRGVITASYATGDIRIRTSNINLLRSGIGIGGLVGINDGTITASYTIAAVDGGFRSHAHDIGGLVGVPANSTIVASYGFDSVANRHRGSSGSPRPIAVTGSGTAAARKLTAPRTAAGTAVPTQWDAAVDNTLGAWDFGTAMQAPVLRYADYDGPAGTTYSCDQFPPNACGTLIRGQEALR